ncbi:MAG: DMT family transporter [Candidatus Melainabacteria bacterium]|nr:DMT family transporter [Candidatus Melainabacteria bacterium]
MIRTNGNIRLLFIITSLICAVMMGAGDFFGGQASKQSPVAVVGLITQLLGLFVVSSIVLFGAQSFAQTPFLYGIGAGLCGSVALIALYRGLAVGKVSIVAPVSAVLSALIPVIVAVVTGHVFGGLTWIGIGSGLIAVYFLSLPSADETKAKEETGIFHAIIAGIALAFFYIMLGHAETHGNIWTLVGERFSVVSVMLIVILFRRIKITKTIPGLKLILVAGATDVIGNFAFLYSASIGPLPMVAMISSLYPATTLFLGWIILKEKLNKRLVIGIVCAFVCIAIFAMP